MSATTYSIPRWRHLQTSDPEEPMRVLMRQARNPDLGTRAEIYEGVGWRPVRDDERFLPDRAREMPQIDNEWVR